MSNRISPLLKERRKSNLRLVKLSANAIKPNFAASVRAKICRIDFRWCSRDTSPKIFVFLQDS